MKIMHVLPGDSMVESFKKTNIDGEFVVCRECLIEGELHGVDLAEFWEVRAKFIGENYGGSEDDYRRNVAAELEKLQNLPQQTVVNLWFEYELFCQTNMWFCLFLLRQTLAEVYRVQPIVREKSEVWKGFGGLDKEDLQKCLAAKTKFSEVDLMLGANLWEAYRIKDFTKLASLGKTKSECFPKLNEVCEAEIEKQSRPQKTVQKIISSGETDFNVIFTRFGETEGVYGFGDSQIKRMLSEIS